MPAGEQFVEDDAERKNVGAVVGRGALKLLGRHVGRRPGNHSRFAETTVWHLRGVVGRRQARCEAKVHHLDVMVLREHHIGRLEVAVNEPALVCRLERLGHLFAQAQPFRERQLASPQSAFQRFAADILHDDARPGIQLGYFINLADERVVEGGGSARLGEQALERIAWLRRCGQEFERDAPVEHQVVRADTPRPFHPCRWSRQSGSGNGCLGDCHVTRP